ncbi:MAG TPA: bifunctional proline dehydrogenase/L-glutamate gamma-semialdehyde dehydrogenase PutA, partial [Reyranella sp.]|nr:bifunctional proline dehydrogenase/L-glutamate gamma-semialdehyde dehydrogenase PutA [Reyranella sp.]
MPPPFHAFAQAIQSQTPLRAAITAAWRRPETECVPTLLEPATLSPAQTARARALALRLATALREKTPSGGVEGLIHEYALSSQEGVALMCLAEALLRIPDDDTRDALIRDKVGGGDWRAHLGHSPSLFVNAATWGLLMTGRLTATSSEQSLSSALTRLIAKGGEPLIRAAVNLAMRLMGEQFVAGQTIDEALGNGRRLEEKGFRHSYDMLGEAAVTMAQADQYMQAYRHAIHAIGRAAEGRGIYDGPGISIKLSALHPRYSRAQLERVQAELYPRLKTLAVLARQYDIGLNIDAEEADRLDISLDLLERLCFEPELAGWNGIGFVVQAYQKRASFVIDWLIDLGRRSRRRLMVRLVKGAYWDSEIKRAQIDGLSDFPVFTRRIHTDVAYLACARKLLAAPDAAFPQFATHNALTLATLHTMAGENFYGGQYEFQCLHGMGEPLYEEVVGPHKLGRPCRIYAPVGTQETLLAYLVRRLLENGANTSFVNQVANPDVTLDMLLGDPVERARALKPVGAPHPRIALPPDLFGAARKNSRGLDLANEQVLASLATTLPQAKPLAAVPLLADGSRPGSARAVTNPADRQDAVGTVVEAAPELIDAACRLAKPWRDQPAVRAETLRRAADLMEERLEPLLGPIVREAGKTLSNSVGEVREAVDF